jgi:hypothetical protein
VDTLHHAMSTIGSAVLVAEPCDRDVDHAHASERLIAGESCAGGDGVNPQKSLPNGDRDRARDPRDACDAGPGRPAADCVDSAELAGESGLGEPQPTSESGLAEVCVNSSSSTWSRVPRSLSAGTGESRRGETQYMGDCGFDDATISYPST